MIRALIIALNFFVAWFISLLAGVPTATVEAPSSVQKNESFIVNVKINPNGVEDFLRYSMTLPEGWTSEKISDDGATYMMEKQVVKFLWSRVGPRAELNISYKVTPPTDVEGTFDLPCKVSHSVNNLPSHIQLTPLKIVVGNAVSPNNNYVPENTDSTANPAAEVTVSRIIPSEQVSGEFMVDVTINKGDLGSFIKLQDTLPSGFTAKSVSNDGGDWSFENGVVRIQWYNPAKTNASLHIQYKVVVSPELSGSYPIAGHVSYVEKMENKIIAIAPASIQVKENASLAKEEPIVKEEHVVKEEPIAKEQPVVKEEPVVKERPVVKEEPIAKEQPIVKEEPVVKEQPVVKEEPIAKEQPIAKEEPNNITQDPLVSRTQGITFAIQIAAMQRLVPTSYYKNTFGLPVVNAEQIEGLNKYTTGSFATYQDARNSRESVRSKGVESPFVVAYSNGKRVTVQEALMITSQKWIR